MKKKITSIIFYVVAILLIAFYGFIEIIPNLMLSEMARIILLGGGCLFSFLGGIFLSKYKGNNKAMKMNLWLFCALYLVLLITLTMFDPMWGRNNGRLFNWSKENFNIYIENSVNLVPFKTIFEFGQKMFTSLMDRRTIFLNLFGNIICLMPLALFIPMLFKKINNTKKFLFTILGISLGIELTQFITYVGSCDIDDVILNTIGALIAYKIFNIKDINNLIRNVLLLEKNEVNKKRVFITIIPIVIVGILLLGLYKISQNHYDQNLDEYTSKWNYKIEIIDESDSSDTALEKFYENELYEYYFSGMKSDQVYAIINDNEKYLVKDLLNNNPTDYKVSIDRFERAGLECIKKEKYSKINVTVEGNVGIRYEIQNEEIFDIGYGQQSVTDNKTKFELFIIPKNSGESNLTLNFKDYMNDDVVEVKKYKITVNNNLEVKYEEDVTEKILKNEPLYRYGTIYDIDENYIYFSKEDSKNYYFNKNSFSYINGRTAKEMNVSELKTGDYLDVDEERIIICKKLSGEELNQELLYNLTLMAGERVRGVNTVEIESINITDHNTAIVKIKYGDIISELSDETFETIVEFNSNTKFYSKGNNVNSINDLELAKFNMTSIVLDRDTINKKNPAIVKIFELTDN